MVALYSSWTLKGFRLCIFMICGGGSFCLQTSSQKCAWKLLKGLTAPNNVPFTVGPMRCSLVSAPSQILFLSYRHDFCLEILPADKQEQNKKELEHFLYL